MGTKGRYNVTDPDLLKEIRDLKERVSKLERTPQTRNAGIDGQAIQYNGGAQLTRVQDDPDSTQGLHAVNSQGFFIDGEGILAQSFDRGQDVQSGYTTFGGQPVTGARAVQVLARESGGVSDPVQTFQVFDKSGNAIFSDTFAARFGLADPMLSTPLVPIAMDTSTSSSFTDLYICEWRFYHPHLAFNVQVQNDASTIGQIRVHASDDNRDVAFFNTTSGASDVEFFSLKRSGLAFGNSPNGNSNILTIGFRRFSGAGTARIKIISVIGMDLSFTGDF